jgi:predicted ester cyclase
MFDGIEPKGTRVRFSLMMLLAIADGKIIEKRAHFDRMDIRKQLSAKA